MRKFVVIFLGIILVASTITGGTFAYMSADVANSNNIIDAGSMVIGTEPQPFMRIADIMPGGPPQEATVTIYAATPTKFYYKVSSARQTGTSTKLWNAIMVEIKDDVTGEVWSGNLNGLSTDWFARTDGIEGGGISQGHPVNFKVWLPQTADVDKESTATVKFNFSAEQWRPVSN